VGSIAALLISGTINPAGAALPESMSSLWIMVAMVFIIAGVLTTITSIVLSRHERDVEQKDISAERIVTAIDI
jgi:hypothetical protein